MTTKLIAVTLASIENTGTVPISPRGLIRCQTVRAVNDEEVHQSAILYDSDRGALFIPPGESRSPSVTQQLTVSHFDQESEGHLNEALLLFSELTQNFVVNGSLKTDIYFGGRKLVRFGEIKGFDVVTVLQNTASAEPARFTATYTINVLKVSE